MKLTAAYNPLINQLDIIVETHGNTITFQSGNKVSRGALVNLVEANELESNLVLK